MYLYNDALYLAEQLSKFASAWKTRDDISARARNMLRIDNEIEALRSFGNRAYSNEMSTQKTVLRDLIGGELPSFSAQECMGSSCSLSNSPRSAKYLSTRRTRLQRC